MFAVFHRRPGWVALAAASTFILPATAHALPDLKVAIEHALPPAASPGGDVVFAPNTRVTVRTRITNESRDAANLSLRKPGGAAQHVIAWYYVERGKRQKFMLAMSMLGEIGGFSNKRVTARFRIPDNATPGNHRICAVVDPVKAIPEQNESNNRDCEKIRVVRKAGIVAKAPALKPGTARPRLSPGRRPRPLNPGVRRIKCPNPSITELQVGIIRRDPGTRVGGTINVRAVLKNVGSEDYVTQPDQQGVLIYNGRRLLKNQSFGNLRAGQTRIISVQLPWNAAGEFQEPLKAQITYDPDIGLDGNPRNDDCNMRDNSKSVSPARINRLFTG